MRKHNFDGDGASSSNGIKSEHGVKKLLTKQLKLLIIKPAKKKFKYAHLII